MMDDDEILKEVEEQEYKDSFISLAKSIKLLVETLSKRHQEEMSKEKPVVKNELPSLIKQLNDANASNIEKLITELSNKEVEKDDNDELSVIKESIDKLTYTISERPKEYKVIITSRNDKGQIREAVIKPA